MEFSHPSLIPNDTDSMPRPADMTPLPQALDTFITAPSMEPDPNPEIATEDASDTDPEASLYPVAQSLTHEYLSEAPVDPAGVMGVFEDSRSLLLNLAGKILRSRQLDASLADDVVSEAALYTFERYVVNATPISESHLRAILIHLAYSRTIDLVRKEMLVLRTTNNYRGGLDLLSGEAEIEVTPRWGVPDISPEEEVFQQANADRLLTLIARLMVHMTPLQRKAVFHTYQRSKNAKSASVPALEGTGKSHLHRARRNAVHAVPEVVQQGRPHTRHSEELTRDEAQAMLLAGADALDISEGTTYSAEVDEVKREIRRLLYPDRNSAGT